MTDYKTFFDLLAEVTTYTKYYEKQSAVSYFDSCFQIPRENEHFKYLHERNKLLPLYEFVQNESKLFVQYQKEARIIWGLFAFIDTNGVYKDSLRYLFSPFDKKIHKPSLHPHFLIKVFSRNENSELVAETSDYVMNLTKIAYFVRQHEAGNHEFINFFKSGLSNASEFEKKIEVLYVSSEEVDYCILKELSTWCDDKGNISIEIFKEYYKKNIGENIITEYDVDLNFFSGATSISWEHICKNLGLEDPDNSRYKHLKSYVQQINSCDTECEFSYTNFKNKYNAIPLRFNLPIHIYTRVSNRRFIQKNRRSIVVFPIAKQPGDGNNLVGFAMLVIEDDDHFTEADIKIRITQLKAIMGLLGEAEYREVYLHGLEDANKEEIITQTIRAAISQVMARNLSHNIGSHVLPEYRNYFREIFLDANFNENSTHLKSYFDYTQNRMELIADTTISQNDRATFVYTIYDDIIKGFKEIYSKNVGLGLLDAFKLHPNGTNLNITSFPSNLKAAIPGGQLGISAFYLILENIIRNYYKHSNKNLKRKTFTFKIVVNEPEINYLKNHYWQVDIIDEMGSENQNRNIQLLYDLQAHINKNILDESKKLRQFGWGFIEMKAAAAYLLNYPLDRINDNTKNIDGKNFPEQLFVVGLYDSSSRRFTTSNNSDENIPDDCKRLGYRFYLKKAKSILIDNDMLKDKNVLNKINQYSNKGIKVETINPESFKRTEHELVISNKVISNINQRSITLLPETFDSAEEFTKQAWKQYVSEVFKEKIIYHNTLQEYQSENHNSEVIHVLLDEHRDFFLDENGNNVIDSDAKELRFDAIKALTPGKTLFFHGSYKVHPFPENVLNMKNKIIKDEYRIIETVCTQVSIYDERIQKDVLMPNSDYNKLTLRDLHELSGVFIPLKNNKNIKTSLIDAVDLDTIENKRQTSHLKKQIVSRFLNTNDEFLILHFTLFEKMFHWDNKKKKYKDIQDYYERFSMENNLCPNHKLVFSSGRGRPSNLVNNCLYLNLSTLQEVLVNKPSKYALVNLLKSL